MPKFNVSCRRHLALFAFLCSICYPAGYEKTSLFNPECDYCLCLSVRPICDLQGQYGRAGRGQLPGIVHVGDFDLAGGIC